ncbi:mothers against decapentaplegic homolog 6-like isoform X2 [Dendronephthya gigantea]|uniref:mothers against decapentaplegic homolog 6-like isoform X2 n=1 Tax=Dendronephthya gigantea TaxID=151771 RepID=UPI001068FA9B|nr:mothers against decapentaplegic homolog 6-like isoform X2 [Dendronephthya gigantea]
MFSLHRRYLVQKIWSAREICIGDQVSAKAFGYLKEAVHSFLGSLDTASLRLLAKILDEKSSDACLKIGGEDTAESSLQNQRYFISRVWRWPDLKDGSKLKHIEEGSSSEEGETGMGDCLCVNPFHLSRISKREIPYQGLRAKPKSEILCHDDSGVASTKQEESRFRPWITLAYWERDKRVGSMYHGYENTINIYESKTKGHRHGLCLKDLNRTCEINDNTKIVLRNIGEGIQVNLENGDIWIYNKSQSPVFLNGQLLQRLHNTDTPRVEKLSSGYGLKVFDCNANASSRQSADNTHEEQHCLRVSFVKGFGRGYKRQTIMNCPCWVEMFFTLPKS